MGHRFRKGSKRVLPGIPAICLLASMAFAQASLGPLDGGLPELEGTFGQSSQTIEVLLGQSEGLLGIGGNPAAEAQTQGTPPPNNKKPWTRLPKGLHTRTPGTGPYWSNSQGLLASSRAARARAWKITGFCGA